MHAIAYRLRMVIVGVVIIALALPLTLVRSTPASAADFKIVGYVTSWSGTASEVAYDRLTHIHYSFVIPNDSGDGSLKPLDNPGKLQDVVARAHARGVKVLIAVGGWNDGNDSGFERLSANPSTINAFVNNLVNFVNTYNLDGVDIDWEYPDPDSPSATNFVNLMDALGQAMHSRGKLLSAAVVGSGYTGGGVRSEVFADVDYLTLMAYDGGDGAAHSPYSYAEGSLNYWLGRGLPASKAILGVPFYGRPTWASYRTLVANDPQAPNKDTTSYGGQTVYYNGQPTIRQKTQLALQRAGGVMIWELSQDTSDATSLLKTIADTVRGTTPTATSRPTTPTATPRPGSCTAPAWNPATAYTGDTRVSYNNRTWRARWWTQGETPGSAQVWEDLGACSGGGTATPVPPTRTPGATPTTPPGSTTWAPNTYYAIGAVVAYGGRSYRCLQAHTSLVGWEPPNVPALWAAQ